MKHALIVLAATLAAAPLSAATYVVNIGDTTLGATGSIETDGTLGVLTAANILDWTFNLTDNGSSFTLDGLANSQLLLNGTDLTATAGGLFFNFSGTGVALFQNPSIGSGINFICFTGAPLCGGDTNRISISIDTFGDGIRQSGVVQIATASGGVVPEPMTWVMMIAGFGMVGSALRRRRETPAAIRA